MLLHHATSLTQSLWLPRTVLIGKPEPDSSLSCHITTWWSLPPEMSLLGGGWNLPPAAYWLSLLLSDLSIAGSVDGPQLIPFTPSVWATNSAIFSQLAIFSCFCDYCYGVKILILPSAVPAARISPYSQGAQAMQFTEEFKFVSNTRFYHLPLLSRFHTLTKPS